MLTIGTDTKWGRISAIGILGGERYYFMVKNSCVAMMPACAVEEIDGLDAGRLYEEACVVRRGVR